MDNLPDTYSFVDLETTGTNPNRDRIIEIGILRVKDGEIVDTLNTTVNPEIYIPLEIRNLTGIQDNELNRSPTFASIAKEVKRLITGSVFVAHNARFDYGFLKSEFSREEMSFTSKILCTVKLSRRLFPALTSYNLDSIINYFKLECTRRHRAFDDASVLHQFFTVINKTFDKELLDNTLNALLKTPSLPQFLDKSELDSLPEKPGVYIFYAKDNCVLYVGKSTNLKDRIKSHFTNDYLTSRELKISREVARIETIETLGELGALLKESELIKSLQPIYNRRLRRIKEAVVVYKSETTDGLFKAEIKKTKLNEIKPYNIMAIYPSVKKAKDSLREISKTHKLCPKLLGIEKGKGACFNYQIGKCNGICIGAESPVYHNIRFIESFSASKIKKWPFGGAIAISERTIDKKEFHIFDNWIYYGTTDDYSGFTSLSKQELEKFDWDIYKIIKAYLRKCMRSNNLNIIYPLRTRNQFKYGFEGF